MVCTTERVALFTTKTIMILVGSYDKALFGQ